MLDAPTLEHLKKKERKKEKKGKKCSLVTRTKSIYEVCIFPRFDYYSPLRDAVSTEVARFSFLPMCRARVREADGDRSEMKIATHRLALFWYRHT